jgi:hypothetical protein
MQILSQRLCRSYRFDLFEFRCLIKKRFREFPRRDVILPIHSFSFWLKELPCSLPTMDAPPVRCPGGDLSPASFCIDAKPMHFNESGSKNVRTLEFRSAPAVSLKENHAATRKRFSVMTTVTSTEVVATSPGSPPWPHRLARPPRMIVPWPRELCGSCHDRRRPPNRRNWYKRWHQLARKLLDAH